MCFQPSTFNSGTVSNHSFPRYFKIRPQGLRQRLYIILGQGSYIFYMTTPRNSDTFLIYIWYHSFSSTRALSLRNLVSGYECGRVFPAGVGPGSPSRDAANWLPTRSDLSVETRRQYGWLRMVFSGVRLFRAPIWWPSGGWRHARGREHCRGEPGGSLSGGYAPDSAKAEGSSIVDEPGEG